MRGDQRNGQQATSSSSGAEPQLLASVFLKTCLTKQRIPMDMERKSHGDDGIKDVKVSGDWFCCRCEQRTHGIRRMNAIGSAATGLVFPLLAATYGPIAAFLKDQQMPVWLGITALSFAMGIVIVDLVKGPGRSLLCARCEQAELVPADSPRAARVQFESEAKVKEVSMSTGVRVDEPNQTRNQEAAAERRTEATDNAVARRSGS